jgi:hypothetical protein
MASELIITSVRKGLDGGSGYQPVLRTRGMKPAVAERLQIRSGYSHPYPHGDKRNPVVFIHRIERVAGETLHILARVCDAGSDHTGRSNFLAHLVSVEDGEARRKGAGPAEVTQRLPFKTAWNEPPRETDPPVVIGGDRAPGPCAAWQAAGLDPGIAGDLAEAAASGSEVRLIARERDDVLALFADAMLLVPPAKRWQVTFNTCEIEPFDAVWRAVREDLPQAKTIRGTPGVIDLTQPGIKGSDRAYARFARGEATALPWQEAARSGGEGVGGAAVGPAGPRTGAAGGPPGTSPASSAGAGGLPASSVPPPRSAKRNVLDRVSVPPPRPGTEADRGNRRYLALAGTVVSVVIAAVVLLWVAVESPGVRRHVIQLFPGRDDAADAVASRDPGNAKSGEGFEMGQAAQDAREQHKKEEEARKERERAEQDAEEKARLEREKQVAEAAENRKREAAETERRKADQAKTAAGRRRAEAFAALGKLPSVIPTDLPIPGGLGGDPSKACDLGPIDVEELLDLSFSLAVPRESLNGSPFKAWVDPMDDGSGKAKSWIIRSAADKSIEKNAKPIDLAILEVKDGRLELRPLSAIVISNPRFCLLRRSVLLVKAQDPAAKDDAPASVRCAMQLVRPKPAPAGIQVPLITKSDDGPRSIPMRLEAPAGITVPPGVNAPPPALPLEGATVEYEVVFDHQPDGKKQPATYVRTQASGKFCPLLTCLAQPNVPPQPPTTVGVSVEVSLAQGVIKVTPAVEGPGEKVFDLAKLGPVVLHSDEQYEKLKDRLLLPLRRRVTPLVKARVDRFAQIERDSKALTDEYRDDIEGFFGRTPGMPKPTEERRGERNETISAFDNWKKQCVGIRDELAHWGPQESAQLPAYEKKKKELQAQWEAAYSDRLEEWFSDYSSRKFEQDDLNRKRCEPLKSPVQVSISSVTVTTTAKDGSEHTVRLVELPKPGSVKNPGSRTDTLAPAL